MDKHAREAYLTLRVAVVLPLSQALVSGLLIGAVVTILAYWLGFTLFGAALVAAIAASVAWLSGLLWWRSMVESVDSKIEKIPLHSYLEPDALPEPVSVRVELVERGGRDVQFIDLPCSPSKLKALASGLMSGKQFTEASWTGSGGIFTRAEFAKLRDEMLRRGLLALNSPSTPARGYRLTRGGEACVRYLASSTTPPLLESGSIGEF